MCFEVLILNYNSLIMNVPNKHWERSCKIFMWFIYWIALILFFMIYTYDGTMKEKSMIDKANKAFDQMDDKFFNIIETITKASWSVLNVKQILLDQPKDTFERIKMQMGMDEFRDKVSLDTSNITPFTRPFIYTLGTNVMACNMKYRLEHLKLSDMTFLLIDVEREMAKVSDYYEKIFDKAKETWLELEAKRNGGNREFGIGKYGSKAMAVTPIFVKLRETFRYHRDYFIRRSIPLIPDLNASLAYHQPIFVKLSAIALAIFTILLLISTFLPKVTFPHHWLNIFVTTLIYALLFSTCFACCAAFDFVRARSRSMDEYCMKEPFALGIGLDYLKFNYKERNETKEAHLYHNGKVCAWQRDVDSEQARTLYLFKIPENVTDTIFKVIDEYEKEVMMAQENLTIVGFQDDIMAKFERENRVRQLMDNLEMYENSQCFRNSTTTYDEMKAHMKNFANVRKEIDEFVRLGKIVDENLRQVGEDLPFYVKESFEIVKTNIERSIRNFNHLMDTFNFKCHGITDLLTKVESEVCERRNYVKGPWLAIQLLFISFQLMGFPIALLFSKGLIVILQQYLNEDKLREKGVALDENYREVKFKVRFHRGTYMPEFTHFDE